ncbi:MAG TPA: hypothetical protein VHP38_08195 [Ruminiclostridium sp.]|nr:hypothetical protein [Ruminiclostridium sp.]
MRNNRNKVLELLLYAALSIIFIVLYFINKPYDKKPVHVEQPAKTTVEGQVSPYDAFPMQP